MSKVAEIFIFHDTGGTGGKGAPFSIAKKKIAKAKLEAQRHENEANARKGVADKITDNLTTPPLNLDNRTEGLNRIMEERASYKPSDAATDAHAAEVDALKALSQATFSQGEDRFSDISSRRRTAQLDINTQILGGFPSAPLIRPAYQVAATAKARYSAEFSIN